jgi:hypothetical protein
MFSIRTIAIILLTSVVIISSAQTTSCPVIVEQALSMADQLCQDLGRNQACYGNLLLDAQPQPEVSEFQFEQVGDIAELSAIDSIQLSALDEQNGHWGIAIMRVQADIPDTLPGQNVTFVLFGDVTIQNTSADTQNPMQAFYLKTGVGDSRCNEAPESGLLIQTPEGVSEVTFNINGTDVRVGSTILMQAIPGDEMRLTTVEGAALLTVAGEWFPAVSGTRLRMAIGDDLLPTNYPWFPEQYEQDAVQQLPTDLLQRQIAIAAPLTANTYDQLLDLLVAESAPCGTEGLPDCEKFDDIEDWAMLDSWGQPLQPGISCSESENDDDDLQPCSGRGRGFDDRSDDDRDDRSDDDSQEDRSDDDSQEDRSDDDNSQDDRSDDDSQDDRSDNNSQDDNRQDNHNSGSSSSNDTDDDRDDDSNDSADDDSDDD